MDNIQETPDNTPQNNDSHQNTTTKFPPSILEALAKTKAFVDERNTNSQLTDNDSRQNTTTEFPPSLLDDLAKVKAFVEERDKNSQLTDKDYKRVFK